MTAIESTGAALFEAVIAAPDDTAPRLIFADYLADTDHPLEAEWREACVRPLVRITAAYPGPYAVRMTLRDQAGWRPPNIDTFRRRTQYMLSGARKRGERWTVLAGRIVVW